MGLIDADKLLDILDVMIVGHKSASDVYDVVDSMPTVDAVEVVRCKDCKHRDPEDHKCSSGALERAGCVFPVADDYFCSWGERREER